MTQRPTYGQRIPKPSAQGYMRVWAPEHPVAYRDGTALVHRMVYHDEVGPIPEGFEVHHRNGVKTDNRLENLVLARNGDHQRDHHNEPGSIRRNQYGEAPILSIDGRRERARRRAYWRNVLKRDGRPPTDWECPPRRVPYSPRGRRGEWGC